MDIKRAVEASFVEWLRESEALREWDIVCGSDRDALVEPRHIFVACVEAAHLGDRLYRCTVVITLALPLHGASEAERQAANRVIEQRVEIPERFATDRGIQVCGWKYEQPNEVSEGRERGDGFTMAVGVRTVG